jgi:flavodoxin
VSETGSYRAAATNELGLLFARTRRVSEPRVPKILIVFFSRTGVTRKVAEALAHATCGDMEELREARSRSGFWGYLRSGYEATYRKSSRELLPAKRDPRGYDIVFIGSPTWNASLSSPIRSYLEQQRAALPDTGLFVTCAGREASAVLAQASELLAKPPLAKLTLRDVDVKYGPAVQVGEFLETAVRTWEKSTKKPTAVVPIAGWLGSSSG